MTEPTTSNIALIIPNTGDLVGTWGSAAVGPDFVAIDGLFGGVTTVALSSAPVVLTAPAGSITPSAGPTQAQNAVVKFTGALSNSLNVTLPLPGRYVVDNRCGNLASFVVVLRAVNSGEVIGIPPGTSQVYCDGTNVRFVGLPDVGTIKMWFGSTIPLWCQGCTNTPWFGCDGSTFNGSQYPALAAILGGGTTLPDFRGRTLFSLDPTGTRITNSTMVPNGNTLNAFGGSQIQVLTSAQMPQQNTGTESATHTHAYTATPQSQQIGQGGTFVNNLVNSGSPSTGTESVQHFHTVGNASPTPVVTMPPASIGGLWLIATGSGA